MFEAYGKNKYVATGVIQWMLNNAWPSMIWHLYDYYLDAGAGYFAAKKACEPLHIQLDLSNDSVSVVNTTRDDAPGLTAHAMVYSLEGEKLLARDQPLDLKANGTQPLFSLPLGASYAQDKVVLVELELTDTAGRVVSRNVYWRAGRESDYRALSGLAEEPLQVSYAHRTEAGETKYDVTLTNAGKLPALNVKLTLLDSHTHQRLLPAYYSDNYVSLLPDETVHISVSTPEATAREGLFTVRGWNVPEHLVTLR
jgi:hypothetical protein